MLETVKEIGIFVIIAQSILCFVPKEIYTKYVKVLIGIMIIAKISNPVFSLLSWETWEEITFQGELSEEELQKQQEILCGEDSYEYLVEYCLEMTLEDKTSGGSK